MNFYYVIDCHRLSAKHSHRLSADSVFTHLYNSFYGLTCSKYKPGRAISTCVPHKILDDLTQKPTKLIRTEFAKMTSEASSLPTDLKNIHQTVYRRKKKCFLNCLRADMSCINA